ncbi:MAG: hypothetical protein HC903_15495 [Methylacidiphilales bacterium]|nr:hypothetical protein [Candidatus Methylacidiphilales bacterium]NJR17338.1 hypothetical protein [Calothrix sp. CSU_2_0]
MLSVKLIGFCEPYSSSVRDTKSGLHAFKAIILKLILAIFLLLLQTHGGYW